MSNLHCSLTNAALYPTTTAFLCLKNCEGIDMYFVEMFISHAAKPLKQICHRSFETGFSQIKLKWQKSFNYSSMEIK